MTDIEGTVHLLLPFAYRMACGRKVGEHWSSALNIESVNCPECLKANQQVGGPVEKVPPVWWTKMVAEYRANRDAILIDLPHGMLVVEVDLGTEGAQRAVRCYRCGMLLVREHVVSSAGKPMCSDCVRQSDERRRAGLDEEWNAEQERIRLQSMRDHPFAGEGEHCSAMQSSSRDGEHGTLTMRVACGWTREYHPDE